MLETNPRMIQRWYPYVLANPQKSCTPWEACVVPMGVSSSKTMKIFLMKLYEV